MNPYYDDGTCTIYHGDCREVLPTLDLTAVAVVVADPPYGQTSLSWDVPVRDWLPLVEPVGYLWCFGTLRMFMGHAVDFARWKLAQDIVWEKHNGASFHADRFRPVHEQVPLFYRGQWADRYHKPVTTASARKRVVRRKERPPHTGEIPNSTYTSEDGGPLLMRSVIYARSCHGYAIHPTQKPEAIVAPLVEYSCPPGGLVLDPFMGSGTTLRVAKDRRMRAIGIELDEAMCEKAALRLGQEVLAL